MTLLKNIIWELLGWLLVNLLIPVTLPVFFIKVSQFLINIGNPTLLEIINILILNGTYTLVGITLILSLLFDFYKKKGGLDIIFLLATVIILFISCFIFLSSLSSLYSGEVFVKMKDNIDSVIFWTTCSIVIATAQKILFIRTKHLNKIIGNEYI